MSRLMAPRKKDGSFPFEYTPAINTNVAETFRKARERLTQPTVVQTIRKAKHG